MGASQVRVSAAVSVGDRRILVLTGAEHGEAPIAAAIVSAVSKIDVASPRSAVTT
jgi:hypothetical protein